MTACLERAWQAARGPGGAPETPAPPGARGKAHRRGPADGIAAGGAAFDPSAPQLADVLAIAHRAAVDPGSDAELLPAVRELFGTRVLGEAALRPLVESLERARAAHIEAVRELAEAPSLRAAALHRLAVVHEGLMSSLAVLVVEAAVELTERYQRATTVTARMRAELARQEGRVSRLERDLDQVRLAEADLATVADGAPVARRADDADPGEDTEDDLVAPTVIDAPAVGREPPRGGGGGRPR